MGRASERSMISRLARLFGKRTEGEHNCALVRGLLSDYVDEGLERTTTQKMSRHLERCPPCQAFLKTFQATVDLLRSLRSSDERPAPEGFRKRVIERVHREGKA